MTYKKLTQNEYDALKNGSNVCHREGEGHPRMIVGKSYTIKNPSKPTEELIARCTQSSPYSLKVVDY
jgi:hypothetical protein